MARLRNRIRRADYFTDGELLRWHRDKRATYSGLWALAEDSGCMEDDPFQWKMVLWPSPLDADITVELLTQWRDELVAAGKLIPYEVGGKHYLYLKTFHKHESPRNPQAASLPLPPWVLEEKAEGISSDGKRWARTQYTLDTTHPAISTDSVQTQTGTQLTSPALSCPVQNGSDQSLSLTPAVAVVDASAGDFEVWWSTYGKVGSKADAFDLWRWWVTKGGATKEELLTAAINYTRHCVATSCKMLHGRTFLAKPAPDKSPRWPEWANGEEHGSMDPVATSDLHDVLTAGALAFGLMGDDDD